MTSSNGITVIFTDLDGTLLDGNSLMSDHNIDVLNTLIKDKKDVIVIPITGRNSSGKWNYALKHFNKPPYRVFGNGSHIQTFVSDTEPYKNTLLSTFKDPNSKNKFDESIHDAIYQAVDNWNSLYSDKKGAVAVHTMDGAYIREKDLWLMTKPDKEPGKNYKEEQESIFNKDVNIIMAGQVKYMDAKYNIVKEGKKLPYDYEDIIKMTCSTKHTNSTKSTGTLTNYLEHLLNSTTKVVVINPSTTKEVSLIEITKDGIDKGTAVEAILTKLKNDYIISDVYCIGDASNDLPMMQKMMYFNHQNKTSSNKNQITKYHAVCIKGTPFCNSISTNKFEKTEHTFDNDGWGKYFEVKILNKMNIKFEIGRSVSKDSETRLVWVKEFWKDTLDIFYKNRGDIGEEYLKEIMINAFYRLAPTPKDAAETQARNNIITEFIQYFDNEYKKSEEKSIVSKIRDTISKLKTPREKTSLTDDQMIMFGAQEGQSRRGGGSLRKRSNKNDGVAPAIVAGATTALVAVGAFLAVLVQ